MITVQINTRKADIFLRNLKTNIQKGGEEISKDSAKMAAREYIKSAQQAGIRPWRGTFYNMLMRQSQQPRRLGKYTYGVSIAATKREGVNYFIGLDRMKPHKVRLFKNRIITKWAQDAISPDIQAAARFGADIWVQPHPFIDRANKIIIKKARKIARKKIRQKVRQSKR